jgi:hypothetical protein
MLIHGLIERRPTAGRWIYLICAAIVSLFALWSAHDGLNYAVPYIPIWFLCIVQFVRPTLLGWLVLIVAFTAYTVGVVANLTFALREFEDS